MTGLSELYSKEVLARELKYYQHEKQHKEKSLKSLKQKTSKEDLLQYNDQQILIQLRKHIVQQNVQRFQNQLFQQDIFQTISHYLMENPQLTYERFLILKQISPDNIKKYFTSKVFLYLCPDRESTAIHSIDFIKFMDHSMKIEQFLLKLMQYTTLNENIEFITTEQLQEFIIHECIPLIDPMSEMDESFYEFYCCQIIQKCSFYLDLQNMNRINIRKFVHSSIMNELLSLMRLQQLLQEKEIALHEKEQQEKLEQMKSKSSFPSLVRTPSQEENEMNLIIDKINENWFSVNKSINLYTIFLNLDLDRNGLLNVDEIGAFQGFAKDPIQFTRIAWTRIFDELIIFSPFELDYRGFIRLILLLDDLNSIPENRNLIVDQQFHIIPHYHHTSSNLPPTPSSFGSFTPGGGNNRKSSSNNLKKAFQSNAYNPYYELSNGYNALKFFWKLLTHSVPAENKLAAPSSSFSSSSSSDLSNDRLTPAKIKLFYDDIFESMKSMYQLELPSFHVFLMEYYDLMNYSVNYDVDYMNEHNIGPSFQDLLQSNQCKLLVLLLLDAQTYWKYENREYLIANQVNEQENTPEPAPEEIPQVKLPIPLPSPIVTDHQVNATAAAVAGSNSPITNAHGSPPHGLDTHMTNYHYYSDDSYEEDSFEQYYSGDDNTLDGDEVDEISQTSNSERRKKKKDSSLRKKKSTTSSNASSPASSTNRERRKRSSNKGGDSNDGGSLASQTTLVIDEEEIDQLEEMEKEMKNKYQNYSMNNTINSSNNNNNSNNNSGKLASNNLSTSNKSNSSFSSTSSSLKDLLGKNNQVTADDDDYDF